MKKINKLNKHNPLGIDRDNLLPASVLPFPIKVTSLFYLICFLLIWILPLGAEGTGEIIPYLQGCVIVAIITAGISFLLRLKSGRIVWAVFVQALFVRLLVLACFYLVAPAPLTFSAFDISTPTLPVWDDDVHYVGAAETINGMQVTTKEILFEERNLPFQNKVAKIGLLISYYKELIGKEQIWVRLIHCLIGAMTSVLVVLSLRGFFSFPAQKLGTALAIIGPAFVQSSILLYKEVYVQFAAAMFLYVLCRVAHERRVKLSTLLFALLALLLFWWSRQEAFTLALIFLALHLVLWLGKISRKAAMRICFVVLLTALSMALLGFGIEKDNIQKVILETIALQGTSFGWASTLAGPARIVHVPLSFANPPPFLLHEYIMIDPGHYPWFRTVFRELRTLQWWWMAPWIVFGLWAYFKRFGHLATFVMPYVCLWFVAAIAFNGVGPEVVRYRDSFLPCAVFLAVGGYEYAGEKWRSLATKLTVFAVFGLWFFMNFR